MSKDRGVSDGFEDGVRPPASARVAAAHYFADRLDVAARYAGLLATDAVVRGLVGPREVPRIWERHLLNSAALTELIPPESAVVDVGSGAGLPGIALALSRPDLRVTLLEPQARRVGFLHEVVAVLSLPHVDVLRARAEEATGELEPADVVVARAVAPLDRLARWCLPLLTAGGRLLALKGASAPEELARHRDQVARLGGVDPEVVRCGSGLLDPPATVIQVARGEPVTRVGSEGDPTPAREIAPSRPRSRRGGTNRSGTDRSGLRTGGSRRGGRRG